MPKLKKLNRVITVEDAQINGYLTRGYDLINEDGKVIKHATGGKSVPVAEYNKAISKIDELKDELKEEVAVFEVENNRLEKEVEKLKGLLNRKPQNGGK